MISEAEFRRLSQAFDRERANAQAFAEDYNSRLPRTCPECGDEGHVPGLKCPACGYRHGKSWLIVRDNDWGYDVIALVPPRRIHASFVVEL